MRRASPSIPSHSFFVDGNPIPKARARIVNGHAYTPASTQTWESAIAAAYDGPRFEGPIGIRLDFYRADRRRCDLDNLIKACLDGLTNGRAWINDDQIVELVASKWHEPSNPVGVAILIQSVMRRER